jgi:magnesium-protoporphyrin IX monomethyl ester (oxidative) cyclase
LYLATYLKSNNISSKIFDLGIHRFDKPKIINNRIRFGVSDQEIEEIIKQERPKIVGIGCMFSRHYIDVLCIVRLIKKIDPSIKIVVGGNHATSHVNIVLMEKSIDFVVMGEGEVTFLELCRKLLNKEDNFADINGLAFRDSSGLNIITPKRNLIPDINSLEIIDYSFLNIDGHLDDTKISPFLMRYPSFGVISSRGCPGECVFCTVKNVWGRSWRGRSPKHFVDEVELLNKEYGVGEFAILDDTASLDRKRWIGICDEIINRKLDIKWTTPNGIAHWTLDREILNKMKQAGCYRITFGIESGCPKTRDFIHKPYSLEQAKSLIQHANKIGMWTICTNIIGFPYEEHEDIEQTVEFAKKSGTDFATFYLLAPDISSEVYSYFKKEKLLDYDAIFKTDNFDEDAYEEMESVLSEGGVDTLFFSKEQLRSVQMKAYRSFIIYRGLSFLFTLRLIHKIRNLEDFNCALRFLLSGIKIFINSFFRKNTHSLLYD